MPGRDDGVEHIQQQRLDQAPRLYFAIVPLSIPEQIGNS